MDIESKKWRIVSAKPGQGTGYTLTNKATNQSKHIPAGQAPSSHHLAAISENQFDKELAELFNSH